jgi:branched-chain amino acid transport system ATP-binding protein
MIEPTATATENGIGEKAALAGDLLEAKEITATYLSKQVLFGVSLHAARGEVVAVLGHNGAGKTTLLKAISGLVPVETGGVIFAGEDITGRSATQIVRSGISFMPAEADSFRDLTVRENLQLGGFTVRHREPREARMGETLELFPTLREKLGQPARTLSGGQRRMLAIAMSLMTNPSLLLLDELSLGLAPVVAEDILRQIREIAKRENRAVMLVEQNVRAVLQVADRAYFMRNGRIILEEPGEQALARGQWWDLF